MNGNNWIMTFTGKHFNPFNPNPDDIDILDIAHALSNICRFNGHSSKFYSVAEHSVIVSVLCPEGLKLAGLLHDAAEAYMGDMPTPLKTDAYQAAEWILLKNIFRKFEAGSVIVDPKIREVDEGLLFLEAHILGMRPLEWDWIPSLKGFDFDAVGHLIQGIPPATAERLFLTHFRSLTKQP